MVLDAAVVAVVVTAAAAASSMPPRLPRDPPPTNLHGTHSIQYFKSLLVEREAEAASPPNQRPFSACSRAGGRCPPAASTVFPHLVFSLLKLNAAHTALRGAGVANSNPKRDDRVSGAERDHAPHLIPTGCVAVVCVSHIKQCRFA